MGGELFVELSPDNSVPLSTKQSSTLCTTAQQQQQQPTIRFVVSLTNSRENSRNPRSPRTRPLESERLFHREKARHKGEDTYLHKHTHTLLRARELKIISNILTQRRRRAGNSNGKQRSSPPPSLAPTWKKDRRNVPESSVQLHNF